MLMFKRRTVVFIWLGLVLATLSPIVFVVILTRVLPSAPLSPVSVRLAADGAVLVALPCKTAQITSFEVIVPRGQVFDDADPRIWRIRWAAPVPTSISISTIQLGTLPGGAVEEIPWRGLPSDPRQGFVVQFGGPDGFHPYDGLTLGDISQGRVRFQSENMNPARFDKASRCS
ncbi:MAG: hypothetical protein M3N98_05845 [Actinomycetota bacterium]|nr:hypothetical protein [Actinomycetota bacterium]